MINADPEIWRKVNLAIQGESAPAVVATLLSGLISILMATGAAEDEDDARILLAATMLLPVVGSGSVH